MYIDAAWTRGSKYRNIDKNMLLCVKISSLSVFKKLCLDSREMHKVKAWH